MWTVVALDVARSSPAKTKPSVSFPPEYEEPYITLNEKTIHRLLRKYG